MSRIVKYDTIEKRRQAQRRQVKASLERTRTRKQWQALIGINPDTYTKLYEEWEYATSLVMSLERALEDHLYEEGILKKSYMVQG